MFGSELNELSLKDGFQMSYLLMQAEQAPAQSLDVCQGTGTERSRNRRSESTQQPGSASEPIGRGLAIPICWLRPAKQFKQVNRYFDTPHYNAKW